jgi:hypothetical protein
MRHILFLLFLPSITLATLPLKSELEFTAIQYFVDGAHPETGLVLDKIENFKARNPTNRVASIAATGFGLAVAANAAKRGLLLRSSAEEYILKTLKFSRDHVPRRKGWFLHWIDWETGQRAWKSEYSPIDTALFLAGALYAAQIFPGGKIEELANEIYRDLDFQDFLTNGGTQPNKKTMSLSWSPENGYEPYEWEIYAEQKILLLLGLGHPTRPTHIDTWFAWKRFHSFQAIFSGIMGLNMPIFVHQYSEVFFDFRGLNDGSPDYFINGMKATETHRKMLLTAKYETFKKGFWGVSAGEDPEGYKVYDPTKYNGTVCIGCTIASVMFNPEIIMKDITGWRNGEHKDKIWGKYGFVDSINIDRNWFSRKVLGITVGPAFLSLANMDESTSVWQDFMKIPGMQKAVERIRNKN